MRTFSVVTTYNRELYEKCAQEAICSFDRFWPEGITLFCYLEDITPVPSSPRIKFLDLHQECPELVAFKQRHAGNPAAHGLIHKQKRILHIEWHKRRIRLRKIDHGFGYRWNAVRFSHKVFAIAAALSRCQTDVLIWLDADVRTFRPIPDQLLESVIPEDCVVSYLARPKFSECGFVCYNLKHPAMEAFINDFTALYTTDELFRYREYHDSFLFDIVRRKYQRRGYHTHDIGEGIGLTAGHVFINSKLGQYMDHMKGDRKDTGRSSAKDLVVAREEAYWRSEEAGARLGTVPAMLD